MTDPYARETKLRVGKEPWNVLSSNFIHKSYLLTLRPWQQYLIQKLYHLDLNEKQQQQRIYELKIWRNNVEQASMIWKTLIIEL